ncbi:hypothetical protein PGH07_07385 [Sulfurovum sp. zt1-1]|uniref:Porin n=1 Tax=Sulfurovum zhangzhouensis TaxID=3019067 RepID=A0ABT7QYT9_9BACT|nr:hypothetical protein [Sulfurovum zhangzhouensis]MDM5271997.1 hypothetical protein [Sulfurovum zhangzhouensis]
MKLTKLSLIAALAVSSAFAGGDIAPVEPAVEAPAAEACNANTTINGKATAYYWTFDGYGYDLFDKEQSQLGAAVTLDVSHKITDNVSANFTAVGYTNVFDGNADLFESWGADPKQTGAYFNVANITATYGDTTFVLGRQLLDTPMISGFDWLLAPGSFEAYTVVNKSISNLSLVGSYIRQYRGNNTGNDFADLDGDNWAVGASYSDAFDASIWYYNVDAAGYTEIYADAGAEFSGIKLAAQIVSTDWDGMDDSMVYGIKASGSLSGFDLMAAYVKVEDSPAGFVDNDALYTSMWNSLGSLEVGDAFKVEAATEYNGLAISAAYVYFDNSEYDYEGHEFDLVLGYGITDCISVDAIYSNTDAYISGFEESNALELIATYKF